MDSQKDINETSYLKDVTPLAFIVLKTERLTSGLYLVTSLLSDNEPLKWRLREEALSVFTDVKKIEAEQINDYNKNFVFYKNVDLNALSKSILDLVSLLELAIVAGTVSTMNLSLVKNEYQALKKIIQESIEESMSKFVLSGYERPLLNTGVSVLNSGSNLSLDSARPIEKNKGLEIPKTINNLSFKKANQSQLLKQSVDNSGYKNERQDKISGFLKDKGWVSIKDIAAVIPECSVKTVQRDLSDMVDKGTLKKRGDRRWSRYALVS